MIIRLGSTWLREEATSSDCPSLISESPLFPWQTGLWLLDLISTSWRLALHSKKSSCLNKHLCTFWVVENEGEEELASFREVSSWFESFDYGDFYFKIFIFVFEGIDVDLVQFYLSFPCLLLFIVLPGNLVSVEDGVFFMGDGGVVGRDGFGFVFGWEVDESEHVFRVVDESDWDDCLLDQFPFCLVHLL